MQCFRVLRQNKNYLWLAFGIFVLGWVIGELFTNQILHVIQPSLDQLKLLAEKAKAKDSVTYTSGLILGNNIRACVTMILVGILACAPTILSLLFNGMMIGVMLGNAQESVFGLVAFGILPHGIFEMPAIFIASAFGIKLGRVLLVPLREKTRWQSFKFVWREVWSVSWFVLVLLVVAASVEGMVTPVLLHTFVVQ
ncbi:stage II sporulation protein M [Tumebacillus sp. ITR2]|uniref:Stage II sporulation protein M n=1 Tax=Tumebacillus amylolyticus TaxID=2801339 RepID=A0ABS1JGH0_9BACL|nr:stage II sporulation protein M [Tumebacillus amylolyticus]MBL0389369.1 stage II sporulation protein M [Tumebacillus amylolyticus]